MPVAATCVSVVQEPSGRVLVNFEGGIQVEYASRQDLLNKVYEMDQNPIEARKWLVAHWASVDPGLTRPDLHIEGKTCVLNSNTPANQIQVV